MGKSEILDALRELGGAATASQIKAHLRVCHPEAAQGGVLVRLHRLEQGGEVRVAGARPTRFRDLRWQVTKSRTRLRHRSGSVSSDVATHL